MKSARQAGLQADPIVLQRVIALATAAGAGASSEDEAVGLLRALGDLASADSQEIHAIARWVHRLYPAEDGRYLPPLEPDLLAEELIATVAQS